MARWYKQFTLVLLMWTLFATGCVGQNTEKVPLAQPAGTTQAIPDENRVVHTDVVQADPVWFACHKDAECKTLKGICNEPQAVNFRFETDFAVYRDRMSRMVDCMEGASPVVSAPSRCLKGRCALNPDQG